MFPRISRLLLHWKGAQVYSQTGWGWGPWLDLPPLDPPLFRSTLSFLGEIQIMRMYQAAEL